MQLTRYRLARRDNGDYYYTDVYTDKTLKFSRRLSTISDYSDYVILVY
jgi:hypothetical protein